MPLATLHQLDFEAIGTIWAVEIYQPLAIDNWRKVSDQIHNRIAQFDAIYSRFRSDSLVTTMSQAAGAYELPPDDYALFEFYRQLYDLSGGAVTPLIGQVLSDAGYDAHYSLQPKDLTPPPPWDEVLALDFPRLTLSRPALLDFGAAGKGYLVDLVAQLLEQQGIMAYCVDAGGDMRYHNPDGPALRVGLEHPADPAQVVGVAELPGSGLSLCGSAGNRRAWSTFHHIIDPHNLASPKQIVAVWVTAAATMLADGLTTALYLLPAPLVQAEFEFEYAIMRADGTLDRSPGFAAEIFSDCCSDC